MLDKLSLFYYKLGTMGCKKIAIRSALNVTLLGVVFNSLTTQLSKAPAFCLRSPMGKYGTGIRYEG
jgi:hypothetical protein